MENVRYTDKEDKIILKGIDEDLTENNLQTKCEVIKQNIFRETGRKRTASSVYQRYQYLKRKVIRDNNHKQDSFDNRYHSDPVKNEEAKEIIEKSNQRHKTATSLFSTLESFSKKDLILIRAFIDYLI